MLPGGERSIRPCRRGWRGGVLAVVAAFLPSVALGWSNHPLCTWQATAVMPGMADRMVRAEAVGTFLADVSGRLPAVLDGEEKWARETLPFYAPRPDDLRFGAAVGDEAALRAGFLHAIRVNDGMTLGLYVQRPPGVDVPADRLFPWSSASVLRTLEDTDPHSLERVAEGDMVRVADVVATATNEPDFGLDIDLWQDNGAAQGARYGFGVQPFGNPHLSYGTQAPFHMGFYHESAIVYRTAGYLQRTYPEARIHLFMTLSRFAFAQGHPYWGWRFAGWAVHYVQDLGQPYHVRVLPGVSAASMVWIGVLDRLGVHGPQVAAVIRVTNRHVVLENYQYRRMSAAYRAHDMDDPLLMALRDTSDDVSLRRFASSSVREVISAQSAAVAGVLDAQLVRTFPAADVVAAEATLDVADRDMNIVSRQAPPGEQARMTRLVADRMRQVGRDTRAVIRVLDPEAAGR
ncbi:phospholipase C/P1 nuclease family protein [Gluconacetobacter takamatsuzukensis]|uniref:Phospholipase n=1 Tax=Gluconacetobacter takamatsuzukensis TaxID=1286190 RepID=A0A7W4PNL8_9PROT|nr:phospholipase [Gluconacetobacter takamatsuzukensis]MBB2204712.1 phospholipase [Gluconacetobacter takamatsuzukensis]